MAANKTAEPDTNIKTPKQSTQEFPSAFSLFEPSWEAIKLNFGTFLVLLLAVLGAISVAALIGLLFATAFKDTPVLLYSALAVLGVALLGVCMVLAPATVHVQIKSAQKTTVGFNNALEQGKKYIWRFWGMSLLVGLIVIVGFILLIVPGIFMIKRYLLASYFLVDKDLPIGEAMRASAEASKKYSGAVWGILGVEVLISIANSIPFIGSIVGFVLNIAYYCAPAIRYEQIKAAN
jgi:hypothetical protein